MWSWPCLLCVLQNKLKPKQEKWCLKGIDGLNQSPGLRSVLQGLVTAEVNFFILMESLIFHLVWKPTDPHKYEQIRSFNSTLYRTRQIGDYWWTWSITLSQKEVQPLHQTLVKTWNHVNQNWADGRLLGIYWSAHWSLMLLWPVCRSAAEAPSGSLVVCSLGWYQPN